MSLFETLSTLEVCVECKPEIRLPLTPVSSTERLTDVCFLGGNPFGGGSPFGQSVDAEEILRSFFEGRDSPFGGFQTRSGGFSEYEQVQV